MDKRCYSAGLLIAMLFCLTGLSETVHVSPSDGANAIQNAIYARTPGDTIALSAGKFYVGDLGAGLYLLDSLTIIAEDGFRSCTLSGASSDGLDTVGTIITCYFDIPRHMEVSIVGLVIEGARGETGGGVMAYNGCPGFDRCTFRKNVADSSGGALFIAGSSISLTNCILTDNHAYSGGGIFAYDARIYLRSTLIRDNEGSENGGGLFLVSCDLDFSDLELSGNNGWTGAGGMLVDVTGDISQSLFSHNNGVNGGCLMITGCLGYDFTITNSQILGNEGWEGGGFFLDSCEIRIEECDFTGNRAVGYGGICFLHRGKNILTENHFYGNESVGDGAGLFFYRDKSIISRNRFDLNEAHTYGGALYVYGNSEPVIRENLFNSNKVFYGSAIYVEYQSKPLFIKNTVVNNIGNMGACISVCEASLLRADSCFFADNGSIENRVSGLGGAVANADSVYITNSHIYFNTLYSDGYWTNACSLDNDLSHCFWWTLDTFEIRGFLDGPCLISPIATDFIPGVPGEPYTIISIDTYADDFVTPVEMIEFIGDTLWLQVTGQDRNNHLYEACVLRIRTEGSTGDIGVALAETDTCSGIYRGRIIIAQATDRDTIWRDDVWNRIRVNPGGDTMRIYAITDTTAFIEVAYTPLGVEEQAVLPSVPEIFASPNPFNATCEITIPQGFTAGIFDIYGRHIYSLPEGSTIWNAANLPSGIYLIRAEKDRTMFAKRLVLVK